MIKNLTLRAKYYYNLIKAKNIDTYLILAGVVGITAGLFFSIELINKIFAWFVLLGVCIKLYDFSEKVERSIIPYDFNALLPPPKKQ